MHDRLIQLRKTLKLSQSKFADAIDVSQGYISEIEAGKKPLVDRMCNLICLKFNVNRTWVQNGVGQIFNAPTASTSYSDDVLKVIENYTRLPPELQSTLQEFLEKLVNRIDTIAESSDD